MSELGFVHRFEPSPIGDSITLLVLHGTGGDENSLLPFARAISPTAALISVRGKVQENGMPRFFRRFAEGVFDYDDIRLRSDELAAFVDAAAATYSFDRSQLVAIGYSNGANIGWSTMLRHPESLAGAILFRPMLTLTEEPPRDLSTKRIFVASGRYDPVVPHESVDALVRQMKDAGAEVEMYWHEGGHELSRDEVLAAARWLDQTSSVSSDLP